MSMEDVRGCKSDGLDGCIMTESNDWDLGAPCEMTGMDRGAFGVDITRSLDRGAL